MLWPSSHQTSRRKSVPCPVNADLFEALELDSMDHVNIMTALWERTGVEIAERDYGRLRSIDAISDHISVATT